MNKKSIYTKLIAALVCTTFLYGCSSDTATTPQTNTTSNAEAVKVANLSTIGDKDVSAVISELVTYDKEDYYTDWKNESPNYIELTGNGANIKGSGAAVKDRKITITAAGVYVLSGTLSNGQIIIDVQDKGTVKLVLNGVDLTCSNSAPIYVMNAGKTIVSLPEGTENKITDGEKYVLADASTDEPNAAIFSKDDLVINGKGKLIVNGKYNNGIVSKDDLKITGGTIQIASKDDGIIGKDIVAAKDATIAIEAGGDGIKSTNDTEASKGNVAIESGTYDIKAVKDGIQAQSYVLVSDGTFNITTGGGSVNAPKRAKEDRQGPWGNDNTAATTTETEKESSKGLKAAGEIAIKGGTFNIDSKDDSVHSNNSVTIAGGDITVTAGDDGIHADASINIKAGKINVTKSYEGIESSIIAVSNGEIHVTSDDDGFNVSGGADQSSVNGRPGQNNFDAAASSDSKLVINGGYISVDAAGDGLDSNRSMYMTNGTVIVNGPTADMNAALDYNGTFEVTGGFLVAAGSAGMAQAPSDQSTQYSIAVSYSQRQSAGTVVHLQDSNGKTIATFAPAKDYQTVVITSPDIKKDSSYTLYSGGSSTSSGKDGLSNDGAYKAGTKIIEFETSTVVTWVNESGVTTAPAGHMGGGGGRGGKTRPTMPSQ